MKKMLETGVRKAVIAGSVLYNENDVVDEIALLIQGCVIAVGKHGNNRIMMRKGSVFGLIDGISGKYLNTYVTSEESVFMVFPYRTFTELAKNFTIFSMKLGQAGNMISSTISQVFALNSRYQGLKNRAEAFYKYIDTEYMNYKELCQGYFVEAMNSIKIERLEHFEVEDDSLRVPLEYFQNIENIPVDIRSAFFAENPYVTIKHVEDLYQLAQNIVDVYETLSQYILENQNSLIGEENDNIFTLYENLIFQMSKGKGNLDLLYKKIDEILELAQSCEEIEPVIVEKAKVDFDKKIELLGGITVEEQNEQMLNSKYSMTQGAVAKKNTERSLEQIIGYAQLEEVKAKLLMQIVTVYINMEDKKASTDEARKIRQTITDLYYQVYESVFMRYVKEENSENVPPVIEMFLNYGYMDEHLVTEEQLLDLYYLKQSKECGDYPIFTMKEWLREIYEGRHEPSRNEFELDYPGALRERKKTERISPEEERRYLSDQEGKVRFELHSVLKITNKITQGQVLSFCPILYCENAEERLDNLFLKKKKIQNTIDKIKAIDFQCFYRPVYFLDKKKEEFREYIQKEVLPITILMPNIGSRGIMWQEISGVKKDTSARLLFSVFEREDMSKLMLHVLGQYRWEICRSIQGMYWNDIREKSLTSEYFDYAQFFKQNRDLSIEAKDKIKMSLLKCKNSFKEMFVQDYMAYIAYESKGSARLNKISRAVLAAYCPFEKEIREQLRLHPTYVQLIERYERGLNEKRKRANAIDLIHRKRNQTPEPEFVAYMNFLEM